MLNTLLTILQFIVNFLSILFLTLALLLSFDKTKDLADRIAILFGFIIGVIVWFISNLFSRKDN